MKYRLKLKTRLHIGDGITPEIVQKDGKFTADAPLHKMFPDKYELLETISEPKPKLTTQVPNDLGGDDEDPESDDQGDPEPEGSSENGSSLQDEGDDVSEDFEGAEDNEILVTRISARKFRVFDPDGELLVSESGVSKAAAEKVIQKYLNS